MTSHVKGKYFILLSDFIQERIIPVLSRALRLLTKTCLSFIFLLDIGRGEEAGGQNDI